MNDLTILAEIDDSYRVRLRCECPSAACPHWLWVDSHRYNAEFSGIGHVVHPRCKPGHKGRTVVAAYDDFHIVA